MQAAEEALPRVPVPDLLTTCAAFLDWCAPLLSAEELEVTRSAVDRFVAADSPAWLLQAELAQSAADPDGESWLDDFWDRRYLGRRDRIALNANFFCLFPDRGEEQPARAASLIRAAVTCGAADAVDPRAPGTSTAQHRSLMSTTRIPQVGQDTVRAARPGRHVAIACRGRFFRLDVVGPDGALCPHDALTAELRKLVISTAGEPAGSGVGALTTLGRDEWAQARTLLLTGDPANQDALDTVETALFLLVLDDRRPADDRDACAQLLHGDGRNRWFDKSLSFVVFADGTAGVNAEHSRLDGITVAEFADRILGDCDPTPAAAGEQPGGAPAIREIDFRLDDRLRHIVDRAVLAFAAQAQATGSDTLSLAGVGADRLKRGRISPDAFLQLSFQLAHRRIRGFTGATYESVAMRQYRGGRTEAMRVVTPEVLRFVDLVDRPSTTRAQRRAAMHAAAERHVARALECRAGRAPEQHLWELQHRGQVRGVEFDLHSSPGWTRMRDDLLSTSSVPAKRVRYFGFGPTAGRCLGIAYTVRADHVNLHVSAGPAARDELPGFLKELEQATNDLLALLETDDQPRPRNGPRHPGPRRNDNDER